MIHKVLFLSTCFLGFILTQVTPRSVPEEDNISTPPSILAQALVATSDLAFRNSTNALNPSSNVSLGKETLQKAAYPSKAPTLPVPAAQVQHDPGDACVKFTNGSRHEFSSPHYPSNYPNGTDCYKVITAPKGHFIRVKFLDHFNIEPAEHCEYDYLEVRDGLFGYSTLIQKICGTSPPTFLQTGGRHMWLRFHSDSDIQYIGFRAQFDFLPNPSPPPPIDACEFRHTKLNDTITSLNISSDLISKIKYYNTPVDCTWMIQAEDNQKIQLQFDKYELEKFNDCEFNFIEIYESINELTPDRRKKQYCGSKSETVTSKGSVLYIRFYSHMDTKSAGSELKSKFIAYYNFFRDGSQSPCQPGIEHDCSDNTCIDASLKCNGKNDCKLRNDEENCDKNDAGENRTDIALIASVGCVLILGMCAGLVLNIYRKLKQDREELQELKEALQKSRESMGGQSQPQPSASSSMPQVYPSNPGSTTKMAPPQAYGSSPQISSHESAESKDTVVEKSQYQNLNQKRHSNGTTFQSPRPNIGFVYGNGLSNGNQPEGVLSSKPPLPTHHSSSVPSLPSKTKSPHGETSKKPLKVQAEVNPKIPYSPPPPYPPGGSSKLPKSKDGSGSDARKDVFTSPPSEGTPEKEPSEICIEVRDSACQTRDSFLADLARKQGKEVPGLPNRKAPLARGEPVDTFDMSTLHPKRMARLARMSRDFPSHLSVNSTSSTGTDRMDVPALGSLENINEYHE